MHRFNNHNTQRQKNRENGEDDGSEGGDFVGDGIGRSTDSLASMHPDINDLNDDNNETDSDVGDNNSIGNGVEQNRMLSDDEA